MSANEYILNELNQLKKPFGLAVPKTDSEMEDEIVRLIMSQKFRNNAANDETKAHVREAVRRSVSQKAPINFVWPGNYWKLWRLDEAPEADFAELFAFMYFTEYLKRICEIYKPGVWFDFFSDDLIITKLNNYKRPDIEKHEASVRRIIEFLRPYQPDNLKFTTTPVLSQFKNEGDFWQAVDRNLEKIKQGPPRVITDRERSAMNLNVRLLPGQIDDPLWRDKVIHLHDAYLIAKAEPKYHKNNPDKIGLFANALPGFIGIGVTKLSVIRLGVGAGVLVRKGDSFGMTVMSKNQIDNAKFEWQPVNLPGLAGKNFSKIRVIA
ncbi:MAG: hypothetical protein FWD33_03150 [Alphaproteobacteria bacterium]|nr:hypothetical protein [Alphaproteobacteria bacterium]